MDLRTQIKPLLPTNCYLRPLKNCKNTAEIVREGRGKKRKVVGFANQTSTRVSLNISDPKIEKHVKTMILITGSTVLI